MSDFRNRPPPPPKRNPEEEAQRQARSEELEREIEEYLEGLERRAAYRAAHPPKPKTPEQRQREGTRRRLANVAKRISEERETLLHCHNAPYGSYHWSALPLVSWEDRPRAPGLTTQMARISADAKAGCQQSIKFLQQWQEVYELCDRLRYIRPPKVELGKLPEPVAIQEGDDLDDWLDDSEGFMD